jgi:hypothetical protein
MADIIKNGRRIVAFGNDHICFRTLRWNLLRFLLWLLGAHCLSVH